MEDWVTYFRENPAPWLIGLFLGIFYWGFWGRSRRRHNKDADQP